MIRSRSGSSSGSPNRIFNGVRFVLFGFDSSSEAQYRSELVQRGGTDVGKYDERCTHVIVSGRIYDDPVCVAAREDGKTLVTETWINDSVAFGTLADATRILYRPVKDLNGIQGSDLLHICLTGYQRQEREDIMKMVSLMGAHFTKPLIANQVTHLISYKFEGEKYELAKRVKIKLVNHRWLEDCLKAWEILPIDNYTKSGWELEISEAEARDSEEETEDLGMDLVGLRRTGGDSGLQGKVSAPVDPHMLTPNKRLSSIQQKVSAATRSNTSENLLLNNNLSTSCNENSSGKLDRNILNSNVEFDHQEGGSTMRMSGGCLIKDVVRNGELSVPAVTKLETNDSTLSSNMLNTKMDSSRSAVDVKSSTLSYFQNTSGKATPEKKLSNILCTTEENLETKSVLGEARMKCEAGLLQSPGGSALPLKRKLSVSSFGSRSPKSECQESRICQHGTSIDMGYAQLEPTSVMSMNHGLTETRDCFEGAALSNLKAKEDSAPSKFKSLTYKKRALKRGQPASKPKDFPSVDSPSVEDKAGLVQNTEPQKTLDETLAMKSKVSSTETNPLCSLVSPDDKMIRDLPLDDEPTEAMDIDANLVNTASVLENSVIDVGGKATLEEKTPETSFGGPTEFELAFQHDKSDLVMMDVSDVAKETDQPHRKQMDDLILSPGSKHLYSRRLSSTASTGTFKENADKVTSVVLIKKVVARRNLSCKSKLTAENAKKDKSLTTNESLNPKKAAVKPGKVGKVKEPQPEMATNNEKNEAGDEGKLAKQPFSQNSTKKKVEASIDPEKENRPNENGCLTSNVNSHPDGKVNCNGIRKSRQGTTGVPGNSNAMQISSCLRGVRSQPVWFVLSGHRLQRKEFHTLIRRLRGKCCRDSHNWSYQATHSIVPDPVRRTEKFFAAAAAGRWILKTEYLTASSECGKFLEEEPFEWYRKGLTEDGAINLEAPRKWRLLRERTGHGAFYGMRILIYGECIAPSLDTLKRVVKAGDGTILATSPPYTRFLSSGVDYVIVSPSIPRVDSWVQEFLRHEIPCVMADYLVEYICKPGYSLERHVLYKTHSWAEKSFTNLLNRSEEIINDAPVP